MRIFLVVVCAAAFVLVGAVALSAAQQINAKALTDHECDSTEWHFVINQIDQESNAPASIHVTWANGQQADVPLDKFTGGVAHYTTTANLDSTVTSATASIYDAWGGQFNLSHGPCSTPDTTVPTTTPTTVPNTTTPTTVPATTTTQPGSTTTTRPGTTTTTRPGTTTTTRPVPVPTPVGAQPTTTG